MASSWARSIVKVDKVMVSRGSDLVLRIELLLQVSHVSLM